MNPHTFPRSSILVLGANSVHSLLPSTLISQVDSLLESHSLEDAYKLIDKRRKKLEETLHVHEDEAEELHYMYQRIGFQYFTETLFDDAGKHLFNGELDPRILISYYPDLRGSLFSLDDSIDMFAGIVEHMPKETSVDDIIAFNLVRNYSPHLPPNTQSASPTAELRKILGSASKEMLMQFLKNSRTRRSLAKGKGVGSTGDSLDIAIDTVLVKLFAEFNKTTELYALLNESNDVSVSEVELILRQKRQYDALCFLYKQKGEDLKLLDAWAQMIDGKWGDNFVDHSLVQMLNLLQEKRDRALSRQWGLWLLKRSPEHGLKLLMPRDAGKRRERPEEDIILLNKIEEANPSAAVQFLEYLVLQRRSSDKELIRRLAQTWVQQILSYLKNESIAKLWKAKASSYASTRNELSFLSHFTSTTPESDHKRARLKTILLLAGSSSYDPELLREALLTQENLLKFELAIIDSKLGNHRSVLSILVHDIRDSTSAEAYCTLGGDLVPPRIAKAVAEECGLQDWASSLFGFPSTTRPVSGKGAAPISRIKTVDNELKKWLLRTLLEVYMDAKLSDRAAHLVNAQASNLDILDVIALTPSDWPLNMITPFLSRSYRRILHSEMEGKIVKNISAVQNLEVKDTSWCILRDEGAIVEEAADDSDDNSNTEVEKGGAGSFNEKREIQVVPAKVEMQVSAVHIVDQRMGGGGDGLT